MNNILITGVSGFIGRALARYFSHAGHQVYGIDRVHIENTPRADLIDYIRADLPSPDFSEALQRWKVDAVLHCAGRASVPGAMDDPLSDYMDGPLLVFSLLASLRKIRSECAFLNFSSAAVYGNPEILPVSETSSTHPISAYGFHKLQGEIICQEYTKLWKMRTASVRIFSAYGPGLRRQVMWDIVHKALIQPEVLLQGTGRESRDFIHSRDIASAIEVILSRSPLQGEVYNLAMGQEVRIQTLAELIFKNLDKRPILRFSNNLPAGIPRNWCADISKVRSLGFSPVVDLEDGIASFVAWASKEIAGY